MATTVKDTTQQNYFDGFGKGLPIGIRDYDTEGKVMLVLSGVAEAAPVKGSFYYDFSGAKLKVYNGTGWVGAAVS